MAPYLRIAAAIEERIRSSELVAGDRVPSTREISKDFGVAIATATKVLAELAARGVVTAIPGVGTIVASPRNRTTAGRGVPASAATGGPATRTTRAGGTNGSGRGGPENNNRPHIVAAAIDIADREGIGAVTMRRLAVALDVPTMSLYRGVSSKEDLVVGMIDALMGEDTWPPVPPEGWRSQLELVARRQWLIYQAHPWLAQVVSLTRPQLAPGAMMHTEWVLRALAPYRLPPRSQIYVVLTLFGYVKSVAIGLEYEQQAERDTGIDIDAWFAEHDKEFAPVIQSGRYPSLAAIDNHGVEFEFDLASLFEFGLVIVLDGIGAMLDRA